MQNSSRCGSRAARKVTSRLPRFLNMTARRAPSDEQGMVRLGCFLPKSWQAFGGLGAPATYYSHVLDYSSTEAGVRRAMLRPDGMLKTIEYVPNRAGTKHVVLPFITTNDYDAPIYAGSARTCGAWTIRLDRVIVQEPASSHLSRPRVSGQPGGSGSSSVTPEARSNAGGTFGKQRARRAKYWTAMSCLWIWRRPIRSGQPPPSYSKPYLGNWRSLVRPRDCVRLYIWCQRHVSSVSNGSYDL